MYVKILRPVDDSPLMSTHWFECSSASWSLNKDEDGGGLQVFLFGKDGYHVEKTVVVGLNDEGYLVNDNGDTLSRIRYEYKPGSHE